MFFHSEQIQNTKDYKLPIDKSSFNILYTYIYIYIERERERERGERERERVCKNAGNKSLKC